MNDFLHSLRTGKDKRYDRTKRGNDNMPYRPGDRHNSMDKRKRGNYTKNNAAENAYLTIAKLLPPVKTLLETIVTDKKDFLEVEERKAVAMEAIALHLQKLVGSSSGEIDAVDMQKETVDKQTDVAISENMDEVPALVEISSTDMIRDMRAQGFSYDKIARQLDTDNIPTHSGRGKWRGQAVSKLLKQ
jgi:hypothetical protein